MTPPERLRKLADDLEASRSIDSDVAAERALLRAREELARMVAEIDAALDPIEQAGHVIRRTGARVRP